MGAIDFVGCGMMIFLGLILIVLGIINRKGNISTIHWYNRRKVSEADRLAYGKWMGRGTILCGAGLVVGGTLQYFVPESIWSIPVVAGLVVGLGLMLYAQLKFNHGLF